MGQADNLELCSKEHLTRLQVTRREQGLLLLDTLQSLWEALNVPAGDIDREIFGRLMEGPHSLYKSSHDKVSPLASLILNTRRRAAKPRLDKS